MQNNDFENFIQNPSYLMPFVVSLFGVFCIIEGLVCLLLFGTLWGSYLAVPLILGGSFTLIVGVYARLTTRYTEPFGSNAYDRAIISGTKNILAALALVTGLICCLGFLAFL